MSPPLGTGTVDVCRFRGALGPPPNQLLLIEDGRQLDDAGSARVVPGLWDAAALAEARRALLELLRQSLERLHQIPADAAARESMTIGRSAVRAIVRDPLLPAECEDAPSLDDLVAAMEPYQSAGRVIWLAYLGRGAPPA